MRKMKQFWHNLRAKLHFADTHQRTAFGNILRFFAVMILLTLFARAMANAAVPSVEIAFPSRGIITQTVAVQGSITAAGSVPVGAPMNLTVQNVAVREGEHVEKGQPLATFDVAELTDMLAMQQAENKKLRVEQTQLSAAKPENADTVAGAQQALDWAYADYHAACNLLSVLQAQAVPDAAAVAAAQEKVTQTLRMAQQAEQTRNAAYDAYEAADAAAKSTAQTGAAAANILALQIKEKEQIIATLQALQAADGILAAPLAGTVQSMLLVTGQKTGKIACNLADAAKGQLFLCNLDAENADKAQVGSAITVTQKETTANAKISAVELRADDSALVTVRFETAQWKEGAASAVMTLSEKTYDSTVPASAVHQDNSGIFVYTLETRDTILGAQNLLVRTPVTLLESGKTLAGVTGALSGDTAVVVSANKPLANGARVQVIP